MSESPRGFIEAVVFEENDKVEFELKGNGKVVPEEGDVYVVNDSTFMILSTLNELEVEELKNEGKAYSIKISSTIW